MDKKLLFGSFIAVIILIILPLNSVVSFETTMSSSIIKSPLFCIRSRVAIGEEYEDTLKSNYLGKEKKIALQMLPRRDLKAVLVHKAIDKISKMDDETFNRFMRLIINQIRRDGTIKDENYYEVRAFHQLRERPEELKIDTYKNPRQITWEENPTLCWYPGCIIEYILSIVGLTIVIIAIVLLVLTNSYMWH